VILCRQTLAPLRLNSFIFVVQIDYKSKHQNTVS
jgi:hypothetical protein